MHDLCALANEGNHHKLRAVLHSMYTRSCMCQGLLSCLYLLLTASALPVTAVPVRSTSRWTILSQLNGCECCLAHTKSISECFLDYAGCGADFCNCNNADPTCLVCSPATPHSAVNVNLKLDFVRWLAAL